MSQPESLVTTADTAAVATRSEQRCEEAGSWRDPPPGRRRLVIAAFMASQDGGFDLVAGLAVTLAGATARLIGQTGRRGWQERPTGDRRSATRPGLQGGHGF